MERDIADIGSMRCNPVIADLFHRMKYMERRDSGLQKIMSETAKLPGYSEELKPDFYSDGTRFRIVLKSANYGEDVSDKVSDRDQDQQLMVLSNDAEMLTRTKQIIDFCRQERSKHEIMDYL